MEGLDTLCGGSYMPAKDFQELVQRVANLYPRIDWLTILGGSATGYISRSVTPDRLQCILRPVKNHNAKGLAFESQVVAVPTDKISLLREAAQEINSNIGALNGFAAELIQVQPELPHVLWFKTIIFGDRTGFSEDHLHELISENFQLGDLTVKALIQIHRGQATASGAVRYFRNEYEALRCQRGKPVARYD